VDVFNHVYPKKATKTKNETHVHASEPFQKNSTTQHAISKNIEISEKRSNKVQEFLQKRVGFYWRTYQHRETSDLFHTQQRKPFEHKPFKVDKKCFEGVLMTARSSSLKS